LELATTHLKAKKPNHAIRTVQIQQLIEHMKSEPNVILLGDFNADPDEDGITALKNAKYQKSILEDGHFTSYKLRATMERR
jgi:endonuclease/exonuclease/phosphatase family metal-dependent hydrolase